MKKTIIAFVIFAAVSAGAFAQQRGSREGLNSEKRAEMQTQKMASELGLTDDQQKKVLALNVERNKKAQDLSREDASKRKEIREAYVKELDAILTPEQKEKMKEVRKEGRRAGDGQKGGKKPVRKTEKPGK